MQSASASIPATIEVIFPTGLHPTEVPNHTSPASSIYKPHAWASPITGTSPVHDTRFGSSKCACVREALRNNRVYKVPSRPGC